MMNRRAKGRRSENRARKLLESEGYLIEQVRGSVKFNKSVDFFEIGDLLGLKYLSELMRTEIIIVQVKTNQGINKELMQKMIKFREKFPDIRVMEYVFYDRKPNPRIRELK